MEWDHGSESEGSDVEVDQIDSEDELDGERERRRQMDPLDREQLAGGEGPDRDDWLRRFLDDSDDEEEEPFFHADWSTTSLHERGNYPFKGTGGATAQHDESMGAGDFFSLLWNGPFWQHMVDETNRYAQQELEKNPRRKWKPVTLEELKSFIGLCFSMGVMRLPTKKDYWRRSMQVFWTEFGTFMSRDRFFSIWRYLHLTDNSLPADGDRLRKVRWLITTLNHQFNTAYKPYGTVTVDESMVKFKGRLSFRQYMPLKPVKWGIKVWALAESTTGYMHRFQVYTGKDSEVADEDKDKGLAHRVVTELIEPFQFQHIRLFMDNFYTGTRLLEELWMRGVLAAGTVRANRKGLPTALLPKNMKLPKHESRVAQHNDLTFCHWQDTKPVLVLSNFHSPEDTGVVRRRTGNPIQRNIPVPKLVADYQSHMKGVDLMDQMVGYYMIHHRSNKWWRRFFFYIMMVSAHNAYIIAKDSRDVKKQWPGFKDFVEDLATDLLGNSRAGRAVPIFPRRPRTPDAPLTPPTTRPASPATRPASPATRPASPATRPASPATRPASPATGRHELENFYQSTKRKICQVCKATKAGRAGASTYRCKPCNLPLHKACFFKHVIMET